MILTDNLGTSLITTMPNGGFNMATVENHSRQCDDQLELSGSRVVLQNREKHDEAVKTYITIGNDKADALEK